MKSDEEIIRDVLDKMNINKESSGDITIENIKYLNIEDEKRVLTRMVCLTREKNNDM